MCLHDLIVAELEHTKSLSALIYLIDKGREIEISFCGKVFFISRSKSRKYVSLWENQKEQSFGSVEELIENAVLSSVAFLSAWSEIRIETIF